MNQAEQRDDLLWQHLKTLPAFRALLRAVESRFYHAIDLSEPLLDLGCGDGDFAHHTFNQYGRQLGTGLDPWWGPLQKSQRAGVYERGVVQGLGHQMPFPDHFFASAISNSVLEHIPDIQPVLNETSRVLQPGGRFLMTMPNHLYTQYLGGAQQLEKRGLTSWADRYRTGFNFIARHAHTEGIDWWAARLAKAGLAIERWQYYFSPAALHVLEIGHAQGLPSWITHALTGQWVLAPTRENLALTERWVRPYFHEQSDQDGTMVMILARKAADQPIAVQIPEARPFEVDQHGQLVAEETPFPNALPAPLSEPSEPIETAEPEYSPPPGSVEEAHTVERRVARPSLRLPSLRQIMLAASAVLLGGLAYALVSSHGQERPWLAVITWIAGIVAAAFAATPGTFEAGWSLKPQAIKLPGTPNSRLFAAALFVVALVIRLIGINEHPFVLSGTEAALGLDAWRLTSGVLRNPFGTASLSNPALPLYGLGIVLSVVGRSILGVRLLSALAGAAAISATYAAGRRLFSGRVGVAAAVILLGMHTHLHYSRLGLTNIWDPLLMTVSLTLFASAWHRGRRPLWLLTGLIWGVSGYFFTVSRLLPVVVVGALLLLVFFDRPGWRRNGRHVVGAVLMASVTALPLIRHYQTVPGVFWERYNQYGVGPLNWIKQQALVTGRPVNALWLDHIVHSLTPFNGAIDRSLYYQPERGFTGLMIGLLLLVGVVMALRRGRRLSAQLLLLWLGTTLYFAGILMIESPASHRYLIATPAVALLAALPLNFIAERLVRLRPGLPPSVPVVLVTILALISMAPDIAFYFGPYRDSGIFADANTEVGHRIGETVAPLPIGTTVYLLGAPRMFSDFPNISFLAPQFIPRQSLLDVDAAADLPADLELANTVWVVLPERADGLAEIEQRFPGGETTVINGRYAAPLFFVYAEAGQVK